MREFLEKLDKAGKLIHVTKEVSAINEVAAIIKKLDEKPVIFEKVKGSEYPIAAGLCSSKQLLMDSIGIKEDEFLDRIVDAIDNPVEPKTVKNAPCQEVVEKEVDLTKIPIMAQLNDGMPYITAGVCMLNDPEYGQNMDFHRLRLVDKDKLTIRIYVRHSWEFFQRARGEMDIAIAIGNHPSVLLPAATHCEIGKDETWIANKLKPLKLVKCQTVDLMVPSECEFVLEGRITKEMAEEGPFPDITSTADLVRKQPVIRINRITHRKKPIYQTILGGYKEHRVLMGLPREPTIFREVNKVCRCLDVNLTTGGFCWLHGIVKIKKEKEDDGKKAAMAAFKGHPSLKHVVVVDEDIDIYDPTSVEFALALRFQADRDAEIFRAEGSSLDVMADPETRITAKVAADATIPLDMDKELFLRAKIIGEDRVKLEDYLDKCELEKTSK